MAITFVNAATERFASATSVSPAEPASAAEDDVFIALSSIDSVDGAWTDPAGWTEVAQFANDFNLVEHQISYIARGVSAPGLSWSYSGTAAPIRTTIYAFRGVDTTTPLDVTWVKASHYQQLTDDPTGANPAITTNTDNSMILLLHTTRFSAGGTPGAPSGYSLSSTGHGSQPQQNAAYKVLATAGTETPGVWTHTGFSVGADPDEFTLALKEDAAAGIIIPVPTGPWR